MSVVGSFAKYAGIIHETWCVFSESLPAEIRLNWTRWEDIFTYEMENAAIEQFLKILWN